MAVSYSAPQSDVADPPAVRPVRRLDDRLIDKIAAGEVVERPASIVKELVENAVDAGARSIDIAIEGGGVDLIRVADDGHGIGIDELPLAVSRHCTSKIADAAGLAAIVTLGFRGEALPSIGAVSRLSLTSRRAGAAAGATISVTGGRVGEVAPAGRAVGTTVEVRDVFFATPARRKFLKSERSEAAAIADEVKRLALCLPHVAFTLTQNGRTTRHEPGRAADRARAVLGPRFSDTALVLGAERDGVRVAGLLGLPTDSRASGQHIYAAVNGRVVRDKLITQAVRAGYQDVLASGRQPVAMVSLAIDPSAVDVNVHPAKADVRFAEANAVRGFIVSAVRRCLAASAPRSSSAVSGAAMAAMARRPEPASEGFRETQAAYEEAPRRLFSTAPSARAARPPVSTVRPMSAPPRTSASASAGMAAPEAPEPKAGAEHPLGAAVAQVHGNYIVAQTADGVVLVDQHAAHERIVYEALKAAAASRTPPSQGLLVPEVVELDPADVDRLAEHTDALAALGLELEPFGPGAVAVRATPASLGVFDVAALVRDLADAASGWSALAADETVEARVNHVAATVACHGSVRSGRTLRAEEMNALLRQIEATPAAGQCNHGRPTFVALSLADIERLFERR